MKTTLITIIAVLVLSIGAWAGWVTCPLHNDAPCTFTGQTRTVNGTMLYLYRCSCGDQYWVAN